MLMRALGRLWRNSRGAALVEMAAFAPFLLFLAGGVFEFGLFFYNYQQVETGVRDAARYMSRVTDTTVYTKPCQILRNPNSALTAKETNAKDIAVMGQIGGTTQRVSWWGEANVSFSYQNTLNPLISGYPTYRGSTDGILLVTVRANPTYAGVGFLGMLGLGSMQINVSHTERCIGEG